jgi:phosphocarrier protein
MLHRDLTIVNELGLHARSAAKLAQAARQAARRVWLAKDGEQVDAKQIIDILMLGAALGDEVRVEIEAPEDMGVLDAIAQLFQQGFGE